MAQRGPSEACCTVPPVQADNYQAKGKYINLSDGNKCYTTGPSNATSAIFMIFDVFGFSSQILQGADILAHADGPDHQYRVFMPDFFDGKPLPVEVFPPDTPEKSKTMSDFFQGPAETTKISKKVPEVVKEILSSPDGQGIQKWGSLGYCWGGKIISLTSQPGTLFSVAAEVHPAFVDPNDAKGIEIPFCMLASGDENANDVDEFEKSLKAEHHVETFKDQVHGWMAKRADLKNERVKNEYERGYKTLLTFYHKYL